MRALPPPDQQFWLIEQLAWLLEKRGRSRFLQGPLLELRFPDGPATESAVTEMIEGLLRHVGLGEASLELVFTELAPELHSASEEPAHGAQLVDYDGRRITLEVERSALRTPNTLVLGLCHELTRAWRLEHGFVQEDPALERLLVGPTAVYLGLGIPAVQRTWSRRSEPIAVIGHELSPVASGVHPPQSLSFLLAAQLVARELPRKELKQLLGQLAPNEQEFVHAAMEHLRGAGKGAMGLLLDHGEPEEAGLVVEFEIPPRPVERVHSRLGARGLLLGAAMGAASGLLGVAIFKAPQSLGLIPLGAIAFGVVGWFFSGVKCSSCGTVLKDEDVLCRGCGGLITGERKSLLPG